MPKSFAKGLPRDQDELIELCRQQDWHVSKTASGHWRLASPRGQIAIASGTTSDTNSVLDLRARLKRFGLKPGLVRIKKVQLTEPKVVMDRSVVMEEKVTNVDVPKLPGEKTEVGGKKKRLPSGAVQKAVREVLYENDKEGGLATGEITELVAKRIGEATQKQSVYSVLSLLVERGELTRPSHGYYRLPSRTTPAVKSESKPEDDEEQVLIEFLVMLDKVGAIVKRHIEFRKEFASLAQKLGKNG